MEESNLTQPSINETVGFPGNNTVTPQVPQNKKNWKWLIILILFLVVIGGVTFFVFKSSRSASSLEESPTPDTSSLTNVPTQEPITTPSATPSDKTSINISVLNGTGIAGEAGLLADQLKNLGYTNVTTGNASTQNSNDTQVTFSSSIGKDVSDEITAKLSDMYNNVTTGNSALPAGTDIQVIVGLRKGQTSAPAATDEPTATNTPEATPTATP